VLFFLAFGFPKLPPDFFPLAPCFFLTVFPYQCFFISTVIGLFPFPTRAVIQTDQKISVSLFHSSSKLLTSLFSLNIRLLHLLRVLGFHAGKVSCPSCLNPMVLVAGFCPLLCCLSVGRGLDGLILGFDYPPLLEGFLRLPASALFFRRNAFCFGLEVRRLHFSPSPALGNNLPLNSLIHFSPAHVFCSPLPSGF